MEVMLLAAGKGTRLGEITESTPKCLVPVGGKPMLEIQIEQLRAAGATKIVVNLYHLAEVVEEFLSTLNIDGLEIKRSREPDLYNTGGGLQFAKEHFTMEAPIIVYNADIFCDLDIGELYRQHESSGSAATLVTQDTDYHRVLAFSEEGTLSGWRNTESGDERMVGEAPSKEIQRGFCGIQCVSPVIFDFLGRPDEKDSIINAYLRAVDSGLSVGELRAEKNDWFDIGTPEELARFRKFYEGKTS